MRYVVIKNTKEVAECSGLWLAEGDNKTEFEITFTNNCKPLVDYFEKTMSTLFSNQPNFNPRVYVYNTTKLKKFNFLTSTVNYYIDKRARKPYFIYRLCGKSFLSQWRGLVDKAKVFPVTYPHLLRGFFADEGNIKQSSHGHKQIRIAQKERKQFLENILKFYEIPFNFSVKGRTYEIQGRTHIEKLAKLGIANIHPIKKEKLENLLKSYKEYHYPPLKLKQMIYQLLVKEHTSKDIGKKFKRSQARVQRVLKQLKDAGKVHTFRIRSDNLWIRKDKPLIFISKIKSKYLSNLKKSPKTTTELSKIMNVCPRSVKNRLDELTNLGLVKRNINKTWKLLSSSKKVKVI